MDTTERVKKALATLDRAVQAWYKENDPDNKERYATVHIRTYIKERHTSNVTLCKGGNDYVTFESALDTMREF